MLVAISPSDQAGAAQRARGRVEASFRRSGDTTRVVDLHQSGSAKLRLPHTHAQHAEAILINTAGGLTGGDQFATALRVGAGSEVVVTTQACERAYRATEDTARIETEIAVAEGGRLDWLPQETILFDRSALARTYQVDLDQGASFLAVEAVIFGRSAMGEVVRTGSLHDRWRIRRGGRLIYADDVRFDGEIDLLASWPATLGGAVAMATIVLVAEDCERYLDGLRETFGEAGGASVFEGHLIARVTASGSYGLRRLLIPALGMLRAGRAMPRAWLQ